MELSVQEHSGGFLFKTAGQLCTLFSSVLLPTSLSFSLSPPYPPSILYVNMYTMLCLYVLCSFTTCMLA